MTTDKDWEKWGSTDPYYGVLSAESYRKSALTKAGRLAFFEYGKAHVTRVFDLLSANFGAGVAPASILDFGCGVGRLALPFAQRSKTCTAVDVSESMLAEASKNAAISGIENIEFICSNGTLSQIKGHFGLVHTYIVLQHIPWHRGRKIICALAEKVEQDGFLALHFLTSTNASTMTRAAVRFRYAFPPLHWLRNLLTRRPIFEPRMQMHIYKPEVIRSDIAQLGFEPIVLNPETAIVGINNVFLLAKRSRGGPLNSSPV
jgi:SAM-dependent methyltransferase